MIFMYSMRNRCRSINIPTPAKETCRNNPNRTIRHHYHLKNIIEESCINFK
jgi:hypothetical protein